MASRCRYLRTLRFPPGGIHRDELLLFLVAQRKNPRLRGTEQSGPARPRPAAHQLRGVAVVPKADRVTQLVRDHVARDVWKRERRIRHSLDPDDALRIREEGAGKGHEV